MAEEKNKIIGGTLYLVATPIGNLADISERAVKALTECDFIAAEDTRNSLRLLTALGIKNTLVSYHEHNKHQSGEKIVARLLSGESCALITDAGMPAISDPGEDIVRLCADAGIPVSVIPGACAAVSALSLSGLATARFVFEGFLPVQKSERKNRLDTLLRESRTMILYEAPHKLVSTLGDLLDAFGESRRISLCRELTKLNEDVMRTTLGGAVAFYEKNEPRGEYVLVLEGASEESIEIEENSLLALTPEEHVQSYIDSGMSKMDAIKRASRERGVPKSELYKLFTND